MYKNKGTFLITIVLTSLFFIGCSDNRKEEIVVASVYEVRITNIIQQKVKNNPKNDPVGAAIGGAIVGELIFGAPTLGAIVGAASSVGEGQEKSREEIFIYKKLDSCIFFANANGQKVSFTLITSLFSPTNYFATKCSLLRHNDSVYLKKRVFRNQVEYFWEDNKFHTHELPQGKIAY